MFLLLVSNENLRPVPLSPVLSKIASPSEVASRKIFRVLRRELEIENLMASFKNPDFEVVVPDEGCVKFESLLL